MSSHLTLIFIVVCISLRCSYCFKFPSDFELCHRNDNDCMVKRVNEIVKNHPHGYPEISLPDFEPIHLDKLEVKGNPESPVNFDLQLSDVTMHGFSNTTFTKFTGFNKDPSKIKVVTESTNPQVVIQGKYKITGKLLVVPITGEGESTMVVTGLKMKTISRPAVYMEDGKTFLKSEVYKLQVKADNMKIEMSNLFNGDKVLSDNMLSVMNENWKLLWEEMSPQFSKAITSANAKILDSVHGKIPYEEMFLPD